MQKQHTAEEAHTYASTASEAFCMFVGAMLSRPQCVSTTVGLHPCTVNQHLHMHHNHGLCPHMHLFLLQLRFWTELQAQAVWKVHAFSYPFLA